MPHIEREETSNNFLKSLGFPILSIHETFTHFDFKTGGRRVLVIGPMGSGKTEFASRIWKDSEVARLKGKGVRELTSFQGYDRRNIFFIRSVLDKARFVNNPEKAFSFRSGYIECGDNIAYISSSFDLERIIESHPEVGTYIIDEASFFDERLVYVVRNWSMQKNVMFIFPSLILNFRKDLFNNTAKLLLEIATDVIPLTAYCEQKNCLSSAFYTYRYYLVDDKECPALYFDPLIIVGGDRLKYAQGEANYEARCDKHHYLPGKEYTFFTLKPMAEEAAKGKESAFIRELELLNERSEKSLLYRSLVDKYKNDESQEIYLNSLRPKYIAEKALCYLFCEQNILSEVLLEQLVYKLKLDTDYMEKVLSDNRRPVSFDQPLLL